MQQGILRHFSLGDMPTNKIIDLSEAKQYPIHGLIFAEDLKGDDFLAGLEGEIKFYPVRSHQEFGINAETFEKLNYDEGKRIFDRIRENWILQIIFL